MPERIRAFVLAAGLGERLRPITDHLPKPLLPVLGRSLIELILDRVFTLPVEAVGVNLHHKGDLIESRLARSGFRGRVTLFPEDPLLSTGGALKNAEQFLKGGSFIVHNGDILSDIDLDQLFSRHLSSGNLVTLAVHNHSDFNNLAVDSHGLLIKARVGSAFAGEAGRFAFTGVAVYSPAFLSLLPSGRSDVVDTWNRAVSQGHRIGTDDVTGCRWNDIGSPSSYAQALKDALRDDGETRYIGPKVKGCERSDLHGWVVIEEEVSLGDGASLRDCVVLPGTAVRAGAQRDYCIIGPDFEIPLSRSDAPPPSADEPELIGVGGSDRTYHRVTWGDTTAVLMKCRDGDPDFRRHVELTRFFRNCRVPVPELFEYDRRAMTALFEDLGDTSLYNWLKCPRPSREIAGMYGKALDGLVLLHSVASARIDECPSAVERRFDYDHCRWETGYFLERFVRAVKRGAADDDPALAEEFHRLALMVDSFEEAIIHRDFQSQNIMITPGGETRFIDYQGARIGPPAYDVASLLWDPYCRIEDGVREDLVEHYVEQMKVSSERFDASRFVQSLLPCRLQRHMQALGAYGYLSLEKGKRHFLRHVPAGLRLLRDDVTAAKEAYPALHDLVMRL